MTQEMHVLGIDIAKHVFHAVGMDERGKIVFRKRLSRHDMIPFLAKLPPVLIESREMPGVMPLPGSPPPQGPCPDTSA